MAENPRIVELRRRVDKDPASIAFAQLAEEYRRGGDHEQAVRICRDGLARHPGYLSAQVTLGRALMELGYYEEARRELESVLKVASDNLAAIRALAVIHQRRRHVSAPTEVQQPDVPARTPDAAAATEPAAPVIASPPSASVTPVEIAVSETVSKAGISVVPDLSAIDVAVLPDADVSMLADAGMPAVIHLEKSIVADAGASASADSSKGVADAPPLPDFSDWALDVDLAIELPSTDSVAAIPPQLLETSDPALEQLEQWLVAIVSDRHQSG